MHMAPSKVAPTKPIINGKPPKIYNKTIPALTVRLCICKTGYNVATQRIPIENKNHSKTEHSLLTNTGADGIISINKSPTKTPINEAINTPNSITYKRFIKHVVKIIAKPTKGAIKLFKPIFETKSYSSQQNGSTSKQVIKHPKTTEAVAEKFLSLNSLKNTNLENKKAVTTELIKNPPKTIIH